MCLFCNHLSAGEVCLIDEPQKGSTNARSSMRSVMEGDMGMGLHMRNSGGGGGHSTRRKSIIEEVGLVAIAILNLLLG